MITIMCVISLHHAVLITNVRYCDMRHTVISGYRFPLMTYVVMFPVIYPVVVKLAYTPINRCYYRSSLPYLSSRYDCKNDLFLASTNVTNINLHRPYCYHPSLKIAALSGAHVRLFVAVRVHMGLTKLIKKQDL